MHRLCHCLLSPHAAALPSVRPPCNATPPRRRFPLCASPPPTAFDQTHPLLLNAPPWIDVIPLQCHHPLQLPRHTRALAAP
eukprot:scaffold121088_cov63-Phaeocystis_antarctica.AAC.2